MEPGVLRPAKTLVSLCLPVLLRVHVVVSGQGRRSTRARGRLSEAKTQRRPERERVRGEGGFPLLFCCFVSFFRAGQGKRHVEEKMLAKRGDG